MTILVLSPDPTVFGPPRPCRDIYCDFTEPLPSINEEIEQFLLRHRFLGFRDILVVVDE